MKKNSLILGFVLFGFGLFGSIANAVIMTEEECSAGFVCTDNCDYECVDFYGTVILDLKCRPNETYTYNGKLTVNGLTNKKTVTCDSNPPICDTVLDPLDWGTTDVIAKVGTCTDDGSGCDFDSYTEQTLITSGEIVSVTATDLAGNVAICSVSEPAKIDTENPTCVASLSTTDWTNGDVEVTITCIDGESGVENCTIDTPITTADDTFSDTETKTGTVTDYVGNTNTCVTPIAKIDKITPTFTRTCVVGGLDYPSAFSTGWTNQDVDCTFTLTDANAKLNAWDIIMTSSGNGLEELLAPFSAVTQNLFAFNQTHSFTGTQDRTYSFSGFLSDNATNQLNLSSSNDFQIKIDKTSPGPGIIPVIPITNPPTPPASPIIPSAIIQIDNNGSGIFVDVGTTLTKFEATEEFVVKLNVLDASPGAGIDWSASKITVTGPESLVETSLDSLSGGIIFDESGKKITFTDVSNIFEKAGNYIVDFVLVDKAGNAVNPAIITGLKVEVVASEVSNSNSTFTNTGSTDCGIANNANTCDFILTLKDRFDNPILNRGDIEITFNNQDINRYGGEGYNLTTRDATQTFGDGVRFDGGVNDGTKNKFTFTNGASETKAVSIKSLVPSVEITSGSAGVTQMETKEKNMNISFSVKDVNFDGTVSGTMTTPILLGGTLKFEPWINASLNGQNSPIPLTSMNVLLGNEMEIWAYANNPTIDLPSDFIISVKGHSSVNTTFTSEDLSGGDGYSMVFSGVTGKIKSNSVKTKLVPLSAVINTNLDMIFSSKVTQEIDGKTITYSGGIYGDRTLLGFVPVPGSPVLSSYIVGADIEGGVIEAGQFGQSQTEIDIRENMNRNAANLIAGKVPIDITGSMVEVDLSSLSNNGTTYYKGGTVKVGILGSGIVSGGSHTIVIEDGDLFVAGDLKYANQNDSLGVILINSKVLDHTNGNVFISKDVQQFVGTYFAHGGLTSTLETGVGIATPSITDSIDRDPDIYSPNDLEKQLLLNGTIFTRNTLGSSLFTIPTDPWGGIGGKDEARKYDLHFVRRYVNQDALGTAITDAMNTNCLKQAGVVCDANVHAFVIRSDNKVMDVTTIPPGFEHFDGR